jgi:hypothetical protein
MEASGYRYVVGHASPEGGLAKFREQLRTERWDAMLIGGGVSGNPELAEFKQQIVAAVQDEAPQAKLLEFDHAIDVEDVVGRAFEMA